MNYAFLLVLAAFLGIISPFLLIGAYREGNRRREARATVRKQYSSDAAVRRVLPGTPATPSGIQLEFTLRVDREASWRGRGMILRTYELRDLPTNKVADPASPHLKLSEILYRAVEHNRAASKA